MSPLPPETPQEQLKADNVLMMRHEDAHARRLMLIRMMGETNRMERRRDLMVVIAGILAMAAIWLSVAFG